MSLMRHLILTLAISALPCLSSGETAASPASASIGKTLSTGLSGFGFPLVEADLLTGTAGVYASVTDGSGNPRLSLPVSAAASPADVLVA